MSHSHASRLNPDWRSRMQIQINTHFWRHVLDCHVNSYDGLQTFASNSGFVNFFAYSLFNLFIELFCPSLHIINAINHFQGYHQCFLNCTVPPNSRVSLFYYPQFRYWTLAKYWRHFIIIIDCKGYVWARLNFVIICQKQRVLKDCQSGARGEEAGLTDDILEQLTCALPCYAYTRLHLTQCLFIDAREAFK